jgi:lysophospholipid acyltransferase (LPLAT)-like uncharacterized protein
MKSLKGWLRTPAMHGALCRLIAGYLRFVRWTTRWEVEGTADRDRLYETGKPFLIALWHNRIGMMPFAYAEKADELTVVASNHPDGRIVPGVMGRFGFGGIPVDSKDAAKATRTIVRRLKEGRIIGYTPDGPRGPRLEVKAGLVVIASLAGGVPVVPVTYALRRRIVLKSWDRFQLPLPFNRGVCIWGEAIEIPAKADAQTREDCRRRIEETLNAMTDACDRRLGHAPVPRVPAALPDETPAAAMREAE